MNKKVFIDYFKGNLSREEEKTLMEWVEEDEVNRQELLNERNIGSTNNSSNIVTDRTIL
jgi:hypothetical protein